MKSSPGNGIRIFTMGFSKKKAREFFHLLRKEGVRKVLDIRLNNVSQLAGFTKKDDLEFFLDEIAGIEYRHCPPLAPSKEILDGYKKKKTMKWDEFENRFLKIIAERRIENLFKPEEIDGACLLCSEPEPHHCHRRLVAEYLQSKWGNVKIIHLMGKNS